jgi:hypothetical protein
MSEAPTKTLRCVPFALSVSVAGVLLSGCGIPRTELPIAAQAGLAIPPAASGDLLYVSNLTTVTMYSYPAGKLVGTIKGTTANGDCVDKHGDVFITNPGSDQILVYAHGARTRLRALAGYGLPQGCSIDPSTGDLAASDHDGTVAIYKGAQGSPRVYKHTPFSQGFWCGYDDSGNLFVDGQSASYRFVLAELPKNGNALKTITLDRKMGYPGGVQWDGTYLAVGSYYPPSSEKPVVYRFKITASRGTEIAMMRLGSGASNVRQFWIQNGTLIAPLQQLLASTVFFYKYPRGGKATKKLTAGLDAPVGTVVSVAPRP